MIIYRAENFQIYDHFERNSYSKAEQATTY